MDIQSTQSDLPEGHDEQTNEVVGAPAAVEWVELRNQCSFERNLDCIS